MGRLTLSGQLRRVAASRLAARALERELRPFRDPTRNRTGPMRGVAVTPYVIPLYSSIDLVCPVGSIETVSIVDLFVSSVRSVRHLARSLAISCESLQRCRVVLAQLDVALWFSRTTAHTRLPM